MTAYYKPCGGTADYYSVAGFAMVNVCIDLSVTPDGGSVQMIACGNTCTSDEDCTPCNYECDCYTFENTTQDSKFLTVNECTYGVGTYALGAPPDFQPIIKLCVRRGTTITVDPGIVYYLCSTDCITSGGDCEPCTTSTTTTTTP